MSVFFGQINIFIQVFWEIILLSQFIQATFGLNLYQTYITSALFWYPIYSLWFVLLPKTLNDLNFQFLTWAYLMVIQETQQHVVRTKLHIYDYISILHVIAISYLLTWSRKCLPFANTGDHLRFFFSGVRVVLLCIGECPSNSQFLKNNGAEVHCF